MSIKEIIEKAKELVKIEKEERERIFNIVQEVIDILNKKRKELNMDCLIEVQGSFAHDTWLKEDKDVDIFIFNKGEKEKVISESLNLAKLAFPKHIERYADHPFITVNYKGLNFDIVPAFLIEEGEKIQTPVDRTRLHTKYLKTVLNEELKTEIRIFKKFVKTLDLYGAEIKVGGLSGYLCELLIIHYGSFLELIKNAVKWKPYKTVIGGEWNKEPYPLVVIDPVDKNRNVAASFTKFNNFIVGCNLFLTNPSIKFFEGRKYSKDLKAFQTFEERKTEVIVISFAYPKIPPDIFWGEVLRARRSFISFLKENDFEVLDSLVYSNENDKCAILLELKENELKNKKIHKGPPLIEHENLRRFIEKHKEDVIQVKEGRIYAFVDRKIKNINEAFIKWLNSYSIPKDLIEYLKNAKIYSGKEEKDDEIIKAIVDLALKDFWWLRDDLIKKYKIELQ